MGYTQASLGRLHLDTDPFDSPLPSQRSTLNRRDSHILAEISEMETTFTSQEQVRVQERQNMVMDDLDNIIDLFNDIDSQSTISNESKDGQCNEEISVDTNENLGTLNLVPTRAEDLYDNENTRFDLWFNSNSLGVLFQRSVHVNDNVLSLFLHLLTV